MGTYLITGANRGIGLESCRQIKERGDRQGRGQADQVIAVCRSASDELNNLGISVETNVDITSSESVADLVKRLDGKAIDVLINNAGILERVSLPNLDFESIRRQFEVNAIGSLRLTQALLPNLKKGSKVKSLRDNSKLSIKNSKLLPRPKVRGLK